MCVNSRTARKRHKPNDATSGYMTDLDILRAHPVLKEMQQLTTVEAVRVAFGLHNKLYLVQTQGSGPELVIGSSPEDKVTDCFLDNGWQLTVQEQYGHHVRIVSVQEILDSITSGVFTSPQLSVLFHHNVKAVYATDHDWREYSEKEHPILAGSVQHWLLSC
jgi:hypothetical protein